MKDLNVSNLGFGSQHGTWGESNDISKTYVFKCSKTTGAKMTMLDYTNLDPSCLFRVNNETTRKTGKCIRCSSALPVSHSEVYSSRFESNPMNTLCTKEAGLWQVWHRMRDQWSISILGFKMRRKTCRAMVRWLTLYAKSVPCFFDFLYGKMTGTMMDVMPSHCSSLAIPWSLTGWDLEP